MNGSHDSLEGIAQGLEADAAVALRSAYADLQGRVTWASEPFEIEVRSDPGGHTIDFLRTPAPGVPPMLGGGSETGVTYRVARGTHAIEKISYPR